MRVRLDVSYDGTDFVGWARQPTQRTVQGELEGALATVLRAPVALTVAGRTDAGVHATGQVAHFDLPAGAVDDAIADAATDAATDDGLRRLVRQLAGVLDTDVRVRAARTVPASFDARFSALYRRYEYRLSDAAFGVDPIRRRYVLARPRPLDVEQMASAATGLVGLHDFAAFCRHREGATTTRHLQQLTVARDGPEIVCSVIADAFCHSMVRSLVGALVAVGESRRPPVWPAALLGRDRRADDVPVVAPHGLTLVEVGYPDDAELAARATQTRARRG